MSAKDDDGVVLASSCSSFSYHLPIIHTGGRMGNIIRRFLHIHCYLFPIDEDDDVDDEMTTPLRGPL